MYLLDTTVWIDLLRASTPGIRKRFSKHNNSTIAVSVITLCELQFGLERRARLHPQLRAREQELLSTMIAPLDVLPVDSQIVESYAKVRAILADSGSMIGALDLFIATQALHAGATLVTSNVREFQRVPGLVIEDWR